MGDITLLIRAAHGGDERAANQLYERLYDDLRRIARSRLRSGGRDEILDTNVVVHEAFARLAQSGSIAAADRREFLAYAARAMRSVVVDFVREKNAERRGGGALAITLGEEPARSADEDEVLRVHVALDELEALDPELSRVVELRYFAGCTVPETAEALGVSESTVERQWVKARAFLFDALK